MKIWEKLLTPERGDPLSMYTKFSKKLTFLLSGGGKFCVRAKQMIPLLILTLRQKISMILILLQYIKKILKTHHEAMKKSLLKVNYNNTKLKSVTWSYHKRQLWASFSWLQTHQIKLLKITNEQFTSMESLWYTEY